MSVSAQMVKELRERTGAGMMDCKHALVETNGDIDKAIVALREKGLAKAAKKSGRSANEGVVSAYIHGNGRIGVMIEINCETDFVAKNDKFQAFVRDIAMHVAAMNPKFLSSEEVSEEVKKQEMEIYRAQAKESGKPDNIIEKMVEGRYRKFCDEVCLLSQAYVKNPDQSIQEYINENILVLGENISVKRFIRWELGE